MSKSWAEVFDSREAFRRLCTAMGLLAILLLVCVFLITKILQSTLLAHNDVEVKEGTIIFRGAREDTCVLSLPSNQPWTNTQCDLAPGETMDIRVTGTINLGIHRLVEAAEKGELRESGWVGPEGLTPQSTPQSCAYEGRKLMNLAPELPVGSVVAFFQAEGARDPMTWKSEKPDKVLSVGPKQTFHGDRSQKGTLWLGVNDQIIVDDPKIKDAYSSSDECLSKSGYTVTGPDGKAIQATKLMLETRYERYVHDRNFHAFFNDNVGEFLVQIKIRR